MSGRRVIFDLGGVITHDPREKEMGVISGKYGIPLETALAVSKEIVKPYMTTPAQWDYARGELEIDYWKEIISKLNLPCTPEELITLSWDLIEEVPGMEELLGELFGKGVEMAVCSNQTAFLYPKQLDKAQCRRFFSPRRIVVSCDVGEEKSHPSGTIFLRALAAVGGSPAAYIDDRKGNIHRAMRYGMTPILFPQAASYGAEYLRRIFRSMGIL